MTREEAIAKLKNFAIHAYPNEEFLMAIRALEQEPELRQALDMERGAYNALVKDLQCSDCISRKAVLDLPRIKTHNHWGNVIKESVDIEDVRQLPPVTPQYTEAEIQRMQELEQAEIQKAYELGKADAEKMGQWIARGLVDSNGNRIYECSECHHSDIQAATMIVPYCWYCGAKMQEVME